MIHLDTHVVLWLVSEEHHRLPPPFRTAFEASEVAWSPMVRLELDYLHEIERTTSRGDEVLTRLATRTGAFEDRTPFADVIDAAGPLDFTRDPFDRLIAAQSIAAGATLATADSALRANLRNTIWD